METGSGLISEAALGNRGRLNHRYQNSEYGIFENVYFDFWKFQYSPTVPKKNNTFKTLASPLRLAKTILATF